ncbi:MAG: DUF434 domain-containing protein [Isosphaeraceae bacterium]
MPDSRTHRGPDPHDVEAFGPDALPALRQALADLSWLLSRGYAIISAVKLVGDRWSLTQRQRLALRRAACSDQARDDRLARRLTEHDLEGRGLLIDGFNVVTTVECSLGGGVVLHCRDETYRDLAGIHGTYRKVAETLPALEVIGERLALLRVNRTHWLFDRPVSNSGRIKAMVEETACQHGWNWTVELVNNPDAVLRESREIVATADSAVLDRCGRWFNLARDVIESRCPSAPVIDLATFEKGSAAL